jgi:hypothetical protein
MKNQPGKAADIEMSVVLLTDIKCFVLYKNYRTVARFIAIYICFVTHRFVKVRAYILSHYITLSHTYEYVHLVGYN